MARKFGCLFITIILLNILHIVRLTSGEVDESNLQQRFTSKCDDLCEPKADQPTEVSAYSVVRVLRMRNKKSKINNSECVRLAHCLLSIRRIIVCIDLILNAFSLSCQQEPHSRRECLRGCQYFNIEFLTNARNKGKVVDLNQLVERCGACKSISGYWSVRCPTN